MRREELICDNLGLVHACANRFRNKGIEYDDLFSAGCLGLVKAADGFDESRGFAFSTYAVPAILGEMKRLFRDGGAVKISRALKERAREAAKLREEMTAALSREPTLRELAAKMQVSEYEMAQLVNLSMPVASLTELHEENDRQIDIPVESEEEEIQNKLALSEVLKILPENDRRLIELRYYKGLTQTKTAEILGLSQVQVSRRERTILLELRRKLTG
ncbi:MAG TPA: sigma-70 family RNA polymerase sigma factor [Candidatus Fimenecus excrementavium]|nr:sigma-70 family RNA polymerase sigma factor [Candidatus Fimenecus excrementavium]